MTVIDTLDGLLSVHPTRRQVAAACRQAGEEFSARDISRAIDMDLGRVAYHFRTLEQLGAITRIRDEPVRGSIRHVFEWTGPGSGFSVWLLWESQAEKGEGPELVDVYATSEAAATEIDMIACGDEDVAGAYTIEERPVK